MPGEDRPLFGTRWLYPALGGAAACLTVIAIGAWVVIAAGLYDTTASTPHRTLVAWATHATFQHSVERRAAHEIAPPAFSAAQVWAGARAYRSDCALCHGGPGEARAHWVRGLTPTPPYLLDVAQHWSPAQLYFIISEGVKMTGMPAWKETRSSDQIWNLVAFLQALPAMSPEAYRRMTVPGAGAILQAGQPHKRAGEGPGR